MRPPVCSKGVLGSGQVIPKKYNLLIELIISAMLKKRRNCVTITI